MRHKLAWVKTILSILYLMPCTQFVSMSYVSKGFPVEHWKNSLGGYPGGLQRSNFSHFCLAVVSFTCGPTPVCEMWYVCCVLRHVQLCASPWTSGSSVHGIFQARILEKGSIFYSRGSSWSRHRTHIACISGKRILYHCTTWENQSVKYVGLNISICKGVNDLKKLYLYLNALRVPLFNPFIIFSLLSV